MHRYINIAVADDDTDDQFLFREALGALNLSACNVVSLYDGTQLLDYLFRQNSYAKAKDPPPDFIVLDLNMPMLDGLSALKKIKASEGTRNIPVFVLSTSRSETQKKECLRFGAMNVFTKPARLEELEHMVASMLEHAAGPSGAAG
jgi:two-component system, response regulator